MTTPTTAVTLTVRTPAGSPIEGATLFALLSATTTYQGTVVPVRGMAKTDASGRAVLAVFPNALGSARTTYTFVVQHKSFASVSYAGVTVPVAAVVSLESLTGGQGPANNYVSGALVLDGLQTYLNGNELVLVE